MDATGWAVGALWLGLLTAISPCPLASNLAALSFLGRDARPAYALVGGLLYAAGRALAYVTVGALLGWGLMSAPGLSRGLQSWLSPLLGPLMVVVGLALLGWLPLPTLGGGADREGWRRHTARFGLGSALPMGFVFALAFCPLSAALFFGSLLPLSVSSGRLVLAPLLYGLGSALPVVLFALVLVWAASAVGPLFTRVGKLEAWLRRLTGGALVLIGLVLLWTRVWAPLLIDR
jgi:cytochrome c-type biogenesis protein